MVTVYIVIRYSRLTASSGPYSIVIHCKLKCLRLKYSLQSQEFKVQGDLEYSVFPVSSDIHGSRLAKIFSIPCNIRYSYSYLGQSIFLLSWVHQGCKLRDPRIIRVFSQCAQRKYAFMIRRFSQWTVLVHIISYLTCFGFRSSSETSESSTYVFTFIIHSHS